MRGHATRPGPSATVRGSPTSQQWQDPFPEVVAEVAVDEGVDAGGGWADQLGHGVHILPVNQRLELWGGAEQNAQAHIIKWHPGHREDGGHRDEHAHRAHLGLVDVALGSTSGHANHMTLPDADYNLGVEAYHQAEGQQVAEHEDHREEEPLLSIRGRELDVADGVNHISVFDGKLRDCLIEGPGQLQQHGHGPWHEDDNPCSPRVYDSHWWLAYYLKPETTSWQLEGQGNAKTCYLEQ